MAKLKISPFEKEVCGSCKRWNGIICQKFSMCRYWYDKACQKYKPNIK